MKVGLKTKMAAVQRNGTIVSNILFYKLSSALLTRDLLRLLYSYNTGCSDCSSGRARTHTHTTPQRGNNSELVLRKIEVEVCMCMTVCFDISAYACSLLMLFDPSYLCQCGDFSSFCICRCAVAVYWVFVTLWESEENILPSFILLRNQLCVEMTTNECEGCWVPT